MLSTLRVAVLFGAVSTFGAGFTSAQDYPSKPIRLITSQGVGTPGDLTARLVGSEMPKFIGQPMVVENRTGAGSVIAYEYVAKQVAADGYTVLVGLVPDLAILPSTVKDLRFDPLKDLPPVIGLVEARLYFGSSSKLPWKSFNEMVAYAKANPGKLNYGSSSSLTRLLTAALVRDLGIDVVHVPYAGGAAYTQALLAGEVQMGFIAGTAVSSAGERYRPLASTGDQRQAPHADIPTFAEIGHPLMRGVSYSLNVPVGVPKVAFDKLHAAAARMLRDSEVRSRFAQIQFEIVDQGPELAARKLAEQAQFFADIAKRAGIVPQ